MTIRRRMLVVFAITGACLLAAVYLLSNAVLFRGFDAIEHEACERGINSALNILNQQVEDFNAASADWSAWDDTYQFITDGNQAYIDSNLTDSSLALLGVNLLLFFNDRDELVYGVGFDIETSTRQVVPQPILDLFLTGSPLLAHTDELSSVAGFMHVDHVPMLFSSRPITTSHQTGPIRGTIIFARSISATTIDLIGRLAQVDLACQDLLCHDIPPDFLDAQVALAHPDQPFHVAPLSETRVAGYAIVHDILGRSAFMLRAGMPRDLVQQGRLTINLLALALVASALAFALILTLAIERTVVRRVSSLHEQLQHIASKSDPSLRVRDDGRDELAGLAAITNDVLASLESSTHKLSEAVAAADSANRAKAMFLANMSHEIRTPMTAILGYADLLLEPGTSESSRVDHVQVIRRHSQNLLTLINDILDLSKIESGCMTTESIPCNPLRLIADAAALMRNSALARGLEFDVAFQSPLPDVLLTDPTRFGQILSNLIGNAVKFTHAGSVRIVASADQPGAVGAGPRRLRIDVIDTGIGMSNEQRQRIFQPFTQADDSTTRRFGGTGLGLSISLRLARLLGGDIRCVSTPDRGSTFTFELPIRPTADTRWVNAAAVPGLLTPTLPTDPVLSATHAAKLTAVKVLVADDSLDNQRLITHHLRRAGASVTTVDNGRAALEEALRAEAANAPYHVVLMDMQMPQLDGYSATAQLRAAGYTRPIIALTANAMHGDDARCRAAGCDDYASKPIDRASLIALVQRHIDPLPANSEHALQHQGQRQGRHS